MHPSRPHPHIHTQAHAAPFVRHLQPPLCGACSPLCAALATPFLCGSSPSLATPSERQLPLTCSPLCAALATPSVRHLQPLLRSSSPSLATPSVRQLPLTCNPLCAALAAPSVKLCAALCNPLGAAARSAPGPKSAATPKTAEAPESAEPPKSAEAPKSAAPSLPRPDTHAENLHPTPGA